MFADFRSRWKIFLSCNALRPSVIWIRASQISRSWNSVAFFWCSIIFPCRSPPSANSITMQSVLDVLKDKLTWWRPKYEPHLAHFLTLFPRVSKFWPATNKNKMTSTLLTCLRAYCILSLFLVTEKTSLYAPVPTISRLSIAFSWLTYLLVHQKILQGRSLLRCDCLDLVTRTILILYRLS